MPQILIRRMQFIQLLPGIDKHAFYSFLQLLMVAESLISLNLLWVSFWLLYLSEEIKTCSQILLHLKKKAEIFLVMSIKWCIDDWYFIFFISVRGVRIGGKESTAYAVKGSHKKIPQELIDELKAICQVFFWLRDYVFSILIYGPSVLFLSFLISRALSLNTCFKLLLLLPFELRGDMVIVFGFSWRALQYYSHYRTTSQWIMRRDTSMASHRTVFTKL